jgi:hypothetical protein
VALRPRLSPGVPLSRCGATDLGSGTRPVKAARRRDAALGRAARGERSGADRGRGRWRTGIAGVVGMSTRGS